MFEINLIRDRVVPRNLTLKRTAIAGGVIGLMALVGVVIAFLGMRMQPDIDTKTKNVQTEEKLKIELTARKKLVLAEEAEKEAALDKKSKLAALWQSPMNLGVAFEIAELIANPDWYVPIEGEEMPPLYTEHKQGLAVPLIEFEIGSHDNQVMIYIYVDNRGKTFESMQNFIKVLLGDPEAEDGPVTDLCRRGSFGTPAPPEALFTVEHPYLRDVRKFIKVPDKGALGILALPPAVPDFYGPQTSE